MTANERLEALLNRAGQTISDLPRKWMTCASEPYSGEQCYKAHGAAWAWYVGEDQRAVPELEQQETTRDRMILRQYILHLTDVIDRMETALENVIGERDLLMERLETIADDANLYDEYLAESAVRRLIDWLHGVEIMKLCDGDLDNRATLKEMRDRLEFIANIAIDYDGYRTAKDLMNLIDEMRDIALHGIPEDWMPEDWRPEDWRADDAE